MSCSRRRYHRVIESSWSLDFLSTTDSEIMISKSELHSANYHLVTADLRNIGHLEAKLSASSIDRSLPTLFLTECVLVYIEMEYTDKLIKWIADSFPTAFFINYEQVRYCYWLQKSCLVSSFSLLKCWDLLNVGACSQEEAYSFL